MDGILGVCGGNGVILHPFAKRGLLGNIEPRSAFATPDAIQWKLNFKTPLERNLESKWANVQVIVGAPDCGHSSVLSYSRAKKLSNPKNNESLSLYIRALKKYKPKMFMMENLPKLLEAFPELRGFLEIKYNLVIYNESVAFWGNSQVSRKRLVIVGIRKDFDNPKVRQTIDKVTLKFNTRNLKTSGELIEGLEIEKPLLAHVREPDTYTIPLYYGNNRNLTVKRARELWMTEFRGKTRWEVNMPRMKCQPGVYLNLENNYPKTVRKQNRQFNHRGDMLSPREVARIQGVPDYFKIWYDESRSLYSINKGRTTLAKSPPYEIGSWFYQIISKL